MAVRLGHVHRHVFLLSQIPPSLAQGRGWGMVKCGDNSYTCYTYLYYELGFVSHLLGACSCLAGCSFRYTVCPVLTLPPRPLPGTAISFLQQGKGRGLSATELIQGPEVSCFRLFLI